MTKLRSMESAHREPISSFSTPGNGYTDERDDMRCASLIQAGFRWSVHGPGYRRGTPPSSDYLGNLTDPLKNTAIDIHEVSRGADS